MPPVQKPLQAELAAIKGMLDKDVLVGSVKIIERLEQLRRLQLDPLVAEPASLSAESIASLASFDAKCDQVYYYLSQAEKILLMETANLKAESVDTQDLSLMKPEDNSMDLDNVMSALEAGNSNDILGELTNLSSIMDDDFTTDATIPDAVMDPEEMAASKQWKLEQLRSILLEGKRLNHAQRQRITLHLFIAVALGAVATVAAPTIFPCPAFDKYDKTALLQQQAKFDRERGDVEKVVKRRRRMQVEHQRKQKREHARQVAEQEG